MLIKNECIQNLFKYQASEQQQRRPLKSERTTTETERSITNTRVTVPPKWSKMQRNLIN